MPSFWAIIDPEQKDNIVANPSAETTGNFAKFGAATVTMEYTQARRGIKSYKVAMAGTSQGVFCFLTTAANTTHYASWYAWATTATLRTTLNSGTNWNSGAIIGGKAGGWQRYGVMIPPAEASASINVAVISAENVGTLYIDAVQVEPGSYPTTYLDGDMEGLYRWNGLRHGSSSTRDAQERSGGKEDDLLDDYGITVQPTFSGVGMPSVKNNLQSMATQPGALFQSVKVLPREITLDLNINDASNTTTAATWVTLHQRRQQLINLVKPDRARGAQPFTLVYKGADRGAGAKPLYAKFVYQSGLEFGNVQGFTDRPQLRLLAVDPAWYEDNQITQSLTMQQNLTTANGIVGKINNTWSLIGTGTTGSGDISVQSILCAKDGTVYAGGGFSLMGGVANTTNIAKWNGLVWSPMGAGVTTNTLGNVSVLAEGPNGDIYAGGGFTRMGGVAGTTAIARWNQAAWNSVGGGLSQPDVSAQVNALVFDKNNNLYVGGANFTAPGVSNTTALAVWNGSTWASITATPTTGTIRALAVGKDNTLYVGGLFSFIGTINASNIAKYKNGVWNNLSSGVSSIVYAMSIADDDTLYVGGVFTTAGGILCKSIAKWDGNTFTALGSGLTGSSQPVNSIVAIDNLVYIGGGFTTAGSDTNYRQSVIWNGSGYLPSDFILPMGGGQIWTTVEAKNRDIYVGTSTTGTIKTAVPTNISINSTVNLYPTVTFIGPTTAGTTASLLWLENQSSNERLYFNQTILGGETVTLDFATNKKTMVSDWRGTVYGQPLSGSDFAAFHLLPTTNTIALFMTGQVTTTSGSQAIMQYTPAHWSIDGQNVPR